MDKRTTAIRLLREWANEQGEGATPDRLAEIHRDLQHVTKAVLYDFTTKFDVPGCRYFELMWDFGKAHEPRTTSTWYTQVNHPERNPVAPVISMLTRNEFLARRGIHYDTDEDL